jgi:hypothetical protein
MKILDSVMYHSKSIVDISRETYHMLQKNQMAAK